MKNKAAQELGRLGGLARAKTKTKEELSKIGKLGAKKRWANRKHQEELSSKNLHQPTNQQTTKKRYRQG